MLAGGLITDLAGGAGVVGREERTDDELAAFNGFDRTSKLLDRAAILVPHWGWLGDWLDSAIRPQVRTAHTRRRDSDDGVRRLDDFGIVSLLEAYVARSVEDSSLHRLPPLFRDACHGNQDALRFTLLQDVSLSWYKVYQPIGVEPVSEESAGTDLAHYPRPPERSASANGWTAQGGGRRTRSPGVRRRRRSEEHTSELQSRQYLVCRLLLEKKKN